MLQEFGLYRSAVVMSWLAAMHVLKLEVLNNHLATFNAEAHRRISNNPKKTWKTAKTADDLGLMNEAEFLDCLAAISMLGKNVKGALLIRMSEYAQFLRSPKHLQTRAKRYCPPH